MSAFAEGQLVRVTNPPTDVQRWSDTGTIVRIQGPAGQPDGTTIWLVRFDLLHLERFIPETDLTALGG